MRTLNKIVLVTIVSFLISCNDTKDNILSVNFEEKCAEFIQLNDSCNGVKDTFLWFTDPHLFYADRIDDEMRELAMKYLSICNNSLSLDFVLCGGDWLTDDIQSNAISQLKWVENTTSQMFFKYYPIFGNHDDNYRGRLYIDSDVKTGAIDKSEVINILFGKWGQAYYKFDTNEGCGYVLDTGSDDGGAFMDEYRWKQIDWFATDLLENDPINAFVGMHIVYYSLGYNDSKATDFATNVAMIASAFNEKRSIKLNNNTYDFSNTIGKLRCIFHGHNHMDNAGSIFSIPTIGTEQLLVDYFGQITFDIVLMDYDQLKVNMVRVGAGYNRIIDMAD